MSVTAVKGAVLGTEAEKKFKKRFPPPTTRFKDHPARWVRNRVQSIAVSVPFSHVAILAWVALYYVCFQVVHPIKTYWDTMFSEHVRLLSQAHWDTWRHFFRDGMESYLATMTVLFVLFNPYKHKIDKIDSAREVVIRILSAIALAIPFFIGLELLVTGIQHWTHTGTLAPSIGAHPSLAAKLYADGWTTKAVVVLSGFIARRPMFAVYAFVLRYFAERRVRLGKHDHWYHTAPFRAMVRELWTKVDEEKIAGDTDDSQTLNRVRQGRSRSVVLLVSGGSFVVLCLAGYGAYILNHFA